jgi:hypothetical protein
MQSIPFSSPSQRPRIACLFASNYCRRYRPAARMAQPVNFPLMQKTSQRTRLTDLCHNEAIDDNEESSPDKETNNHAGESEASSQTAEHSRYLGG